MPPLPYTLNRIMEKQRAVIERQVTPENKWGAVGDTEWVEIASVPCRFYWWHSDSGRSTAREYAEPERNVNLRGGGVLVALNTDVTDQDRIGRITNAKGVNVIAGGPFRIVAVEQLESHLDLALFEP